jgi:Protein of unknown function (DUF1749)
MLKANIQQSSQLTAFEHILVPNSEPQNLLIFVNGLFGGFSTVSYSTTISKSLPSTWTLAEVLLSSSYLGWGISSLSKDVDELAECVSYFRGIKTGKIVLMGHSTGCQDVMHYLTGPGHETRPAINGCIIQAPVSDRESMNLSISPEVLSETCKVAKAMVDSGDSEEILPTKLRNGFFSPTPISARRWLSLTSPDHDGEDDYFSSDLRDDQLLQTFGVLPAASPLCILFSGSDEYVPKAIDQRASLKKWVEIVKRGMGQVDEEHSGVIEGATHDLGNTSVDVTNELVRRVLGYLGALPVQCSR